MDGYAGNCFWEIFVAVIVASRYGVAFFNRHQYRSVGNDTKRCCPQNSKDVTKASGISLILSCILCKASIYIEKHIGTTRPLSVGRI